MPGRFFLTTSPAEIAAAVGVSAGQVVDEPPRRNVSPGQEIVVLSGAGDLVRMRWGMIPVGRVNARGRPVMETVVNARGETVFDKSAFSGVARCAVPADGWYEWTGERRRKTAWRIRRRDRGLLWFAAISDLWRGPGGIELPQVAMVTCAPSADVREIHDRMGVILSPDALATWISGRETAARELIRPLPDGTLEVGPADDVDWSAG